ncbi:TYRO protein tyrosine kinase-binding protein isoform X2 [Danio aesculapii]|uniref:TYRO protein tyrosine kinase-binding protein isoform X2 n=1 Tax=Danio aesculapii TaxID=1142201 RepID=UPI0024BF6D58|nr:TYRO protein tyrosine kinase-binding protein isoform X2 [Danio aesculapii]
MAISHHLTLGDFSHTDNFHIIGSDIHGVLARGQKGFFYSSQGCANPEQSFLNLSALIMRRFLFIMLPVNGLFGSVEANQDCSSCYQMDIGVAVGIITCDIFLTLLIALSVYCFVSRQKRRGGLHAHGRCCGSGKAKLQQTSMRAKPIEVESPYQELYGVQSDIYSDLQQYRK